jgi:hypothetical protein
MIVVVATGVRIVLKESEGDAYFVSLYMTKPQF